MNTTVVPSDNLTSDARLAQLKMKLEVIVIPVSNVERAKAFYGGLGWRLDADFSRDSDRVIQFTPPGSQCSVHFGTNQTSAPPGSRAAAAHGEHEKRIGAADPNWPDWYAAYMVAEQADEALPQ